MLQPGEDCDCSGQLPGTVFSFSGQFRCQGSSFTTVHGPKIEQESLNLDIFVAKNEGVISGVLTGHRNQTKASFSYDVFCLFPHRRELFLSLVTCQASSTFFFQASIAVLACWKQRWKEELSSLSSRLSVECSGGWNQTAGYLCFSGDRAAKVCTDLMNYIKRAIILFSQQSFVSTAPSVVLRTVFRCLKPGWGERRDSFDPRPEDRSDQVNGSLRYRWVWMCKLLPFNVCTLWVFSCLSVMNSSQTLKRNVRWPWTLNKQAHK